MPGTSKILSFSVTTTAGEDETSEGNTEKSKRDAVDVAPSVPAPEDEAVAEPDPEYEAAAEPCQQRRNQQRRNQQRLNQQRWNQQRWNQHDVDR